MQNNLTKGLFLNDERFGGHADPLLCEGGSNAGRRCTTDDDCDGGACRAGFAAISRNLYKASFHDITRFAINKIDLATGAVVGKIDIDEANQGTDLVFSPDGRRRVRGRPVLQQPAHLQQPSRTERRSDDRLRRPVALRPGRDDALARLHGRLVPHRLRDPVHPAAAGAARPDRRRSAHARRQHGAHRQRVRRDDGADASRAGRGRHDAARHRDPSRRHARLRRELPVAQRHRGEDGRRSSARTATPARPGSTATAARRA